MLQPRSVPLGKATTAAFLLPALLLSGCSTWRAIPLRREFVERENLLSKEVRIIHRSGSATFVVGKLTWPLIEGQGTTVTEAGGTPIRSVEKWLSFDLTQVGQLEVSEFDGWKTTALVASTVAGLLIVGSVLVGATVP